MAKGLNAAAAQGLIEQGLRSLGGEALAKKATPVVAAALEVARESSRAAGKRSLSITGISVHSGDETIFQVAAGSGSRGQQTGAGPEKRIPIAYGGTHYTCYLVSAGPPPFYFCFYFGGR